MKKSNKMIMMTLLASLAIGGCTPKPSSTVSNSSPAPAPTSSSQVESTNSSSETLPTINSIVWTGVEDAEVQHKKVFGVLTGVSLKATKEGDATEFSIPAMVLEISVEGATLSEKVVDTSSLTVGTTFTITYKISDTYGPYNYAAGVETTKTRRVTVIEASENLVVNGDFENGTTGWTTEGIPASGTFEVLDNGAGNHYAKVNVTGDSGNSYQRRISTEYATAGYGIRLEPGNNYQLTYKAKADNARKIHVQLGQLLTAEPWFNLQKNTIQAITTEWAEYSLTLEYTGTEVYPDCHVVLECGKVEGEYVAGAVYFDDVAVKVFEDEIPDETAPKIEGAGYLRVDKGATLDLMAGVVAHDDRDGDITNKITYTIADFTTGAAVASIDTSVDGKYKVTYTVSDNANNVTTVVRTVRVCDPSAADENAFVAPTNYKNGGEGDAVANPGTLYEWHDQAWCGSTVTVNEFKYENNTMTLDYTSVGSCWFGMQVFYTCSDMLEGDFSLSFKVNSSVACKVTFNGVVTELVAGNNTVTVPAPVRNTNGTTTFNFQFGESATATMVPEGRFVFTEITAYPA